MVATWRTAMLAVVFRKLGVCPRYLSSAPNQTDTLNNVMNDELNPLSFPARQAAKEAERRQIAEELRAGQKPPAQIALEHQPWAELARNGQVRYDLAQRLV